MFKFYNNLVKRCEESDTFAWGVVAIGMVGILVLGFY